VKILLILLTLLSYLLFPSLSHANKDCVILLHGLARTHVSMLLLESELHRHGYRVVNNNYPSMRNSIDALANEYIPPMVAECLKSNPDHIHFVTHSMGGIMLEVYLQHHKIPKLDHIVMLGPPHHGSPWVNKVNKNGFLKVILGPAIEELATKKTKISFKAKQYKIGIIAGNYNLNPFGQLIFGEPNDGKVGVSSTQIEGMNDFILMPVTHTFMMINPFVEDQIIHYLSDGQFIHKTA
jgi:triacylglycerol lipase